MTRSESAFPMFGGKSRAVDIVWPRFGPTVNSYLEPFFGSGAMLLGRPGGAGKYETVNDAHSMIANFWRAVKAEPDAVAHYSDYPVIEVDMHARHQALVDEMLELHAKLAVDPEFNDARLAGWFVWGKGCWIGDGWCQHPEWKARPDITARNGVHIHAAKRMPEITHDRGVHRHIGVHKKMPNVHGDRGLGTLDSPGIYDKMRELAARLRHVRVCSGHWKRICGPSSMGTVPSGIAQGIAPCAVFLDPPYKGFEKIYGVTNDHLHDEVLAFCQKYGENPRVRIALCGYDGEYELPGWEVVPWKAHGGYGNMKKEGENENAHKERIWFSPHTLKPSSERTLHDFMGAS